MRPFCTTLLLFFALSSFAQTPSDGSPPDGPQPHQKRHLFWPNLNSPESEKPLNAGQKFELFAVNTVSPIALLSAAGSAGLSQALDTNTGFGQGAEGYGKRMGAAYAGTASNNFFGTFLFPALLHHDPRYFRKGTGTPGSRIKYALTRSFITRTDSGGTAPNYSFWLGQGASAAISNLYYGRGDRSASDAAIRFVTGSATSTGFNVVKEYWPEIMHKVFKKHRKQ